MCVYCVGEWFYVCTSYVCTKSWPKSFILRRNDYYFEIPDVVTENLTFSHFKSPHINVFYVSVSVYNGCPFIYCIIFTCNLIFIFLLFLTLFLCLSLSLSVVFHVTQSTGTHNKHKSYTYKSYPNGIHTRFAVCFAFLYTLVFHMVSLSIVHVIINIINCINYYSKEANLKKKWNNNSNNNEINRQTTHLNGEPNHHKYYNNMNI